MTNDLVFVITGYRPLHCYMSLNNHSAEICIVGADNLYNFPLSFFSGGSRWVDVVGEDDELFAVNDNRSRKVVEKLPPEEWKISFSPRRLMQPSPISSIVLMKGNGKVS